MGRYIARRLIQAVPLLLGISVIAFGVLRAAPGGPLSAYEADPGTTEADMERLRHAFGLR